MSEVAIRFENISKLYRLGKIGTGTLSHDLKRWWIVNVRKKEDPYIKIGSVNDRRTRADSDYVWALRNIDFDVRRGEVLGIIGKNGAGKSTLLKILSRVTVPTTGRITASGRIASLLEVGTGFHPEMTGRENIFMNGSIMGMTKTEIRRKFDEIVDFAGIERYIDTPVKRYSSGMTVRLGFAIAAHLEPEILVVDEVLAVGDAEFQKKAIGKMQNVSNEKGRTVLFVSHNMSAIQKLCNTAILLDNGGILTLGKSKDVINFYLNQANTRASEYRFHEKNHEGKLAYTTRLVIEDNNGKVVDEIPVGKPWSVKVYFNVECQVDNLIIALGIINVFELPLRTSWSTPESYSKGNYVAIFEEEDIFFTPGRYRIVIGISRGSSESLEYIDDNIWITVSDIVEKQETSVINHNSGLIVNQMKTSIKRV